MSGLYVDTGVRWTCFAAAVRIPDVTLLVVHCLCWCGFKAWEWNVEVMRPMPTGDIALLTAKLSLPPFVVPTACLSDVFR